MIDDTGELRASLGCVGDDALRIGAHRLLEHCGSLRRGEVVVIVYGPSTAATARLVADAARALTDRVTVIAVPEAPMHGTEPPPDAAAAMAGADLIAGLTRMSMAHTAARRTATEAGARYLSLPDYSPELLTSPALAVDFRARAPMVRRLADAFTAGRRVRVTTALGTDVVLDATDRIGNCCPGFVAGPGELGSPPDIEANVSPVETASTGTIVVDGSIACREIGLLRRPVRLDVRDGRIVRIEGEDPDVTSTLTMMFDRVGDDRARVLAECGVGLNEAAELNGTMLMDEGAFGCIHFGFGSNATVGGCNEVAFHLDFVLRDPTLDIDGAVLIDRGDFRV